ncbi:MAG: transporter substrate-binding domain-containing protein, partial [Alphaproteobacteria bacterium]
MSKVLLSIALAAGLGVTATAASAQTTTSATLDAVKAKGYVQCGVTGGVPGFSAPDASNNWTGLEVDFCRAVAAAIFNNADNVRYTPLTSQERFTALSAGEIDILSRT